MIVKNKALFAKCAAPEAIASHLRKARRVLADANREVQWLLALQEERQAQVEAGLWPPPRTVDALIEASSLGTPDAVAMRNRTTDDEARRVVARAHEISEELR